MRIFHTYFIQFVIFSTSIRIDLGRIVFWAQLGPKINIWSIYHVYLSPKLKQSMKIKMKDIVFH